MKCPVDGATLMMMDRSGVEIDYCPQCRGVWLDRGELDKILERAVPAVALEEPRREAPREMPRERGRFEEERYERRRDDDDDYRKKKKRRGFLDDLFDF